MAHKHFDELDGLIERLEKAKDVSSVMWAYGDSELPDLLSTPEGVRREAKKRAGNILSDWFTLNQILRRHEATIQKRWLKKTSGRRRENLLSVWPAMALHHRPDIEAFIKRDKLHVESYLWPHINLEDLTKPKTMLLFLNARGRNPPHAFIQADCNSAHVGYISGVIPKVCFVTPHVMMFNGRSTKESYGELLLSNDHPDVSKWLQMGRGMSAESGLLALRIQERIYQFLVACVFEILHDMPRDALQNPTQPEQSEPPSVSARDTGSPSLATIASEAPYRLPAHLDLQKLASIVQARLIASEDHILALRDDPGYFAETVSDWREHRQEVILDDFGQKHATLLSSSGEDVLWTRVIGRMIVNAYSMFEIWDSLHRQLLNLNTLKEKCNEQISIGEDFPEDYKDALRKIYFLLEKFAVLHIITLDMDFTASPPLRPYYRRPHQKCSCIPDPKLTEIKKGLPTDKARDRLIWIMSAISNEVQCEMLGLSTLMDELERLMESDNHARSFISSWVAREISNLSVLSQCLHQIDLYQPWAPTWQEEVDDKRNELDVKTVLTKAQLVMYNTGLKFDELRVASLGNPSKGRFYHPSDGPQTQKHTEAMRRAEGNLDAFWAEVDKQLLPLASTRIKKILSEHKSQRTSPWTEPSKEPSKGLREAPSQSFSELHLEREHSTKATISRGKTIRSKTKIKTRGTPRPVRESTPATQTDPPETPNDKPVIALDKRALKVFRTLFHTPSSSSIPGEIAWTDFLHAMSAVGFTSEKLYGSVWQFNPTEALKIGNGIDAARSIQFHEPHPVAKVAFRTARRWGRSLTKWYGWTGEMFVAA